MPINEKIRELRYKHGWTQETLAEEAKIADRTIQRAESGKSISKSSLSAIAEAFKIDVSQLLGDEKECETGKEPIYLNRIISGIEMVEMIHDVQAFRFSNDELQSKKELELISEVFQNFKDYADIWNEIEIRNKMEVEIYFSDKIKELGEENLWIFGGITEEGVICGTIETKFNIANLRVVRSNNPSIIVYQKNKASY